MKKVDSMDLNNTTKQISTEAGLNQEPVQGNELPQEIWVKDFTPASAAQFRELVLRYAMMDPERPIIIYIDSYGGQVYSLAKMLDTLDQIGNPTITVCMGKAMSCGAILLSHGDYRYCAPHSSVLIHEVSHGSFGDVHDVHNDSQEAKRLNEHFMDLLAKNCGIKGGYKALRKTIKLRDGRDIYLDADAAVQFGIVDEVGTPAIVPRMYYEAFTIIPASRQDRVKRISQLLGIKKK